MLKCEGYKMFKGKMEISPLNRYSFEMEGTWLYKPDCNCWYCNGRSFPENICVIIEDKAKKL